MSISHWLYKGHSILDPNFTTFLCNCDTLSAAQNVVTSHVGGFFYAPLQSVKTNKTVPTAVSGQKKPVE